MDSGLTFSDHVQYLYNKLQKVGFIIRKLGKFLRTSELKPLYYGHAHSILVYSLIVWGTLISKHNLNMLYKVQKQLIRAVYKLKPSDHCMPFFKRLNLLTLLDLIDLECLLLMYKIKNLESPVVIVNMFKKPTHGYDMRDRSVTNKVHKLTIVNKSFLNRAPMIWQNCSHDIKRVNSYFKFKKMVKLTYIKKY